MHVSNVQVEEDVHSADAFEQEFGEAYGNDDDHATPLMQDEGREAYIQEAELRSSVGIVFS
jgi:hypothetical protein